MTMGSGAARDVAQKTYELGHPSAYVKIRMCVLARRRRETTTGDDDALAKAL